MFSQSFGSKLEFISMCFFFAHRKYFLSALLVSLFVPLSIAPTFAQDETNQPDPVKIFNQGQDAHEKGDLQTALKLYEEAIKLSPEFPEAEYQRGTVLVSLGRIADAEKAFRRAAELREDWALPMTNLGVILISTNRFAEAEKVLTQAVELDEQNFPAYSALVELRLRTKASPEVLKALLAKLQLLTSKNKSAASLWAAQGAIQRALGDQSSALISLNNALDIEPNDTLALAERTEISLAEGNFQRAIDDVKTLVKISPNSVAAKIRLAHIYARSGNTGEALKILDALDASNPEVSSLKNSIIATGTEDVSVLEKQLEKDAKNAAILGRLCVLTRTSNPQKALDYCRRASEAEPNNLTHAVGFGAALVQARQFERAISLLRRLLEIAPDNFTARANLATALFESKRFAEARTEYLWLAGKKPDLAITYYFLAISHDQMGEYVEALTNYQQFLRLANPKQSQLEIDKVNLRLPALQKLAKQKGKK